MASCLAVARGEPATLADIGPAPAVDRIEAGGGPFALGSLKGKAVLVSFLYATCNGGSPTTTATLDRTRRSLRDAGLWGGRLEFVSITLDMARDTLAAHARAYRADPKTWHFPTGPPAEVRRTIAAWEMWARVGPAGHCREIYNLESLTPEAVVQDVKTILAETEARR